MTDLQVQYRKDLVFFEQEVLLPGKYYRISIASRTDFDRIIGSQLKVFNKTVHDKLKERRAGGKDNPNLYLLLHLGLEEREICPAPIRGNLIFGLALEDFELLDLDEIALTNIGHGRKRKFNRVYERKRVPGLLVGEKEISPKHIEVYASVKKPDEIHRDDAAKKRVQTLVLRTPKDDQKLVEELCNHNEQILEWWKSHTETVMSALLKIFRREQAYLPYEARWPHQQNPIRRRRSQEKRENKLRERKEISDELLSSQRESVKFVTNKFKRNPEVKNWLLSLSKQTLVQLVRIIQGH